MTVQGAAGLYGFLASIGMSDRDATLRRVVDCVMDLQSGCACHKRADKVQKQKNCERLYGEAVRFIIPSLSDEILKKTTDREVVFLSHDGVVLRTISR